MPDMSSYDYDAEDRAVGIFWTVVVVLGVIALIAWLAS